MGVLLYMKPYESLNKNDWLNNRKCDYILSTVRGSALLTKRSIINYINYIFNSKTCIRRKV